MKYTRLLLVLASCALYAGCERGQTPPPFSTQQAPEVVVSYPVVKEVTDYEDFPGRVEAINAVDVRARVTGYLQNMHFKEGSEVKKGELLFREGDYGSTAFYILEGQIDIFISSPRAHVNTQKGASNLLNILQNKLVGRREQQPGRDAAAVRRAYVERAQAREALAAEVQIVEAGELARAATA